MAEFTTGIIENTAVFGARPASTLAVRITNNELFTVDVEIIGYFVVGTVKTPYVLEVFNVAPGAVANRSYFADFDGFEFQFVTSADSVAISAWGKDQFGGLVTAQRVLAEELSPL